MGHLPRFADSTPPNTPGFPAVPAVHGQVHRVKNKWKINVRDGVFRVDGQDYLFKKGTGEWSWT